jgi:hypothetical protein
VRVDHFKGNSVWVQNVRTHEVGSPGGISSRCRKPRREEQLTERWQVNTSATAPLSELTVQLGDIPISNQGGTDMRSVSFILSIMGFALELTVFLMTVAVL